MNFRLRPRLHDLTLIWAMSYFLNRHVWSDTDLSMLEVGKSSVLPWPICAICGQVRNSKIEYKPCPGNVHDHDRRPHESNPWKAWRQKYRKIEKEEREKEEAEMEKVDTETKDKNGGLVPGYTTGNFDKHAIADELSKAKMRKIIRREKRISAGLDGNSGERIG